MEFYIQKGNIEQELNRLQAIVERKSTIPILDNVLIRSSGSGHELELIASNLATTLNCRIMADQVAVHGAICLPARRLFEIVRLLPNGMVHFLGDNEYWTKINAGRSKQRIPGADPLTFVTVPELKGTPPLTFSIKAIKNMIEGVDFAIAPEDDVRFLLSGVKFESNSESTKMIAADGHRLALAESKTEELQLDDLDVLIPQKALEDFTKLTSEADGTVGIALEDHQIHFVSGRRILSARLLAGEFPNYEQIINDARKGLIDVVFKASELSAAIKRTALAADSHSYAVSFTFDKEEVSLSASTAQSGEAQETIPIEYSGEPFLINLNAKYLLDYLAAVESTSVMLGVKDARSFVCLRAVKDKIGYACVVMPMEPTETRATNNA